MSTQTTHAAVAGPVIPWWTLGDRIRKARLTADMDQRTFADALGVPAGSLAAWETDRQRPRDLVAVAKRIELLTHIPAAWVLDLDAQAWPGPDGWAPRGSNSQPAVSTSEQVSGLDDECDAEILYPRFVRHDVDDTVEAVAR